MKVKPILLILIVILIVILSLILLKKETQVERYRPNETQVERYVLSSLTGLPDDVIITEILPNLPIDDLLNINRFDSEGTRLIDKFVRGILKFQTVCDLKGMKYFRTDPKREIEFQPENPWLGAKEVSDFSYNLVKEFLNLLEPQPQFKKFITNEEKDPEWIIFNPQNFSDIFTSDPQQFRTRMLKVKGDMYITLHSTYDAQVYEDDDGNFLKDNCSFFNVWISQNANSDYHLRLKNFLQSKVNDIDILKDTYSVFPLDGISTIDGKGRAFYFTLALKSSNYKEYINNIFEMRERPEIIEEEKEREEKSPISSSSSSQRNVPTDSEIVFFIEILKNTPKSRIESLVSMIADPTLKRIFKTDVLGYLLSDNYSKYESMFDEEAFNSVKRNPEVFTRDNITLILESLK